MDGECVAGFVFPDIRGSRGSGDSECELARERGIDEKYGKYVIDRAIDTKHRIKG